MPEEFELVPLDPIKALERRIERLEQSIPKHTASLEFLELVKTNQQVVDDLVKMNSQVIHRLLSLTDAINNLVSKLNDFMSKFEIATSEVSEEKLGELEREQARIRNEYEELSQRLAKLEKRINAMLLAKMPVSSMRKLPVKK